MRTSRLLVACAAVLAVAAAAAEGPVQLRESMSAADFHRAGLHKLTPAELTSLEVWISHYVSQATTTQSKQEAETGASVESHIKGEFAGWEGDTVFVLDNGQVWQQVEYDYEYHYAYHPEVTIVRTRSGWVMKVEGMSKVIGVERVR
jgi:succinylarginine dihydrolase